MSKTKKHVMTKEEVRAPDEFQVALESIWDKLVRHKKIILIALGAFVAVGIAIWVVGLSSRGSSNSRALAQRDATLAIGAPVGPKPENAPPPDPTLPEPTRYPDEAARIAAVDAGVSKFMAEHGGDDAAELVGLTAANIKLEQGKADEALSAVDAWLAAHASSPARPLALELKARVHLQKDQRDQAIAALEELAKSVGGPLKAHAYSRLGDLQNPAMHSGQGDAAKAKAAYEEAMKALPPATAEADEDSPFGPPGLRGELQSRLELLP
ncbi:MAG: tetratricopeptide repeat protein [Myxococcota bacterium]